MKIVDKTNVPIWIDADCIELDRIRSKYAQHEQLSNADLKLLVKILLKTRNGTAICNALWLAAEIARTTANRFLTVLNRSQLAKILRKVREKVAESDPTNRNEMLNVLFRWLNNMTADLHLYRCQLVVSSGCIPLIIACAFPPPPPPTQSKSTPDRSTRSESNDFTAMTRLCALCTLANVVIIRGGKFEFIVNSQKPLKCTLELLKHELLSYRRQAARILTNLSCNTTLAHCALIGRDTLAQLRESLQDQDNVTAYYAAWTMANLAKNKWLTRTRWLSRMQSQQITNS